MLPFTWIRHCCQNTSFSKTTTFQKVPERNYTKCLRQSEFLFDRFNVFLLFWFYFKINVIKSEPCERHKTLFCATWGRCCSRKRSSSSSWSGSKSILSWNNFYCRTLCFTAVSPVYNSSSHVAACDGAVATMTFLENDLNPGFFKKNSSPRVALALASISSVLPSSPSVTAVTADWLTAWKRNTTEKIIKN